MELYATSRPLKNYDFNIRKEHSHKKGKYGDSTSWCEDIFAFDIETTSFFYGDDLKPFLYKPGKDPEYWTKQNAGSLPYLWGFSINDSYYYGRELSEFLQVLDDFPQGVKIRLAVHNLPFEWHHLDFLHWDFIFAKSRHRPIKATCIEYPNIEFFCTYSLIDRSLKEWGEILGFEKFELDYNQLRTPKTKLPKKAYDYQERDLKIMYEGLKEEVAEYGSIWDLPLTATGATRRMCKDLLMSNDDYKRYIKKLLPSNWYQYGTSRKVFWGGYAHGSRTYLGITFPRYEGQEGMHLDYISAYIAQMVGRKGFPCTGWAYAPKVLPDPKKDLEVKAYKLHLRLKGVRCETRNTFIPFDKVKAENAVLDNGKILTADMVDVWCTDLDWYIMNQCYSFKGGVEVLEAWYSYTDYLPLPLVSLLLDLFNQKTTQKHVNPSAYRRAKTRIDSIYGMCATSLIQASINWDINAEEWSFESVTAGQVEERLYKLKYWKDTRYFVSYDWGVYIAAWSRYTLLNDLIIPNDRICMYSDTDSAFLAEKIDFEAYNKQIEEKMVNVCKARGLNPDLIRPRDSKGNKCVLGALSLEKEFSEFRTLGSKRYCERMKDTGELVMTVSGVNKEAVESLKNDINNFKDGAVFDKDSKEVNKLLHTYVDNMPDITFPDGYVSHQRRGVNLRPNGYRLRAERSPEEIIEDIASGAHVSEYEKHLRGVIHDGVIY